MAILAWLIAGLVAGIIASQTPKKHGDSLTLDVVVGLIGSGIGGIVFNQMWGRDTWNLTGWSVLAALVAGAIALGILHAITSRTNR